MEPEFIEVRGAKQHNLRVEFLRIPKRKLVVFTGVSGSGKSSLAFDTLYAEGQRRYVESLSSYARQFLGQMGKPLFESLRGLSPTIAIEQKSASTNPRSTVGTITEIYDYLRVLYARVGTQHCPSCGAVVASQTAEQVVRELRGIDRNVLLMAPLVSNRKGELRDVIADLKTRGFVRVRVDGKVERLEDLTALVKTKKHTVELVIDRMNPHQAALSLLTDSVESAMREGGGALIVASPTDSEPPLRFSESRACAACGIGLPELSPQSFSFNSPLGMCATCNGIGRRMEMDPVLVVPDDRLSIRQGAIEPWATSMKKGEGFSYEIFAGVEKAFGIDYDCPWRDLPRRHKDIVLHGAGTKRIDVEHNSQSGLRNWSIKFEGVLNTLMRRYSETKSEMMREYYQKYFSDAEC
ncbi:MAG: excinuclease ABC subunit UvrA, partial [Polyangiaceae bacterium]|nr:excinuclease ABC subunit UvrA [Polyangiaceae bacterium]